MINPIKGKYEKIEKYYLPRLECNTEDYLMLGWENKDAQFKRFSVLNEIIDNNMTILDVGCGLGNLLDYFDSANHHVYYTGIDIISKMISIAGQKKPHGDFRVVDIFKNTIFTHRKFDIVYSSGIFNIDLGNNDDFLNSAISKFDELSEKYIVFNLLHKRSINKEAGYYYCDPDKIHSLIVNHDIPHKRIKIIDDYLTNDFTVIIFK